MQGNAILIILSIIVAGVVLYALIQGGAISPDAEAVTIRGTYMCLPHLDSSGPNTLECAFGLRTPDGAQYALDTGRLLQNALEVPQVGEEIEARGELVPRADLVGDNRFLQYDIEGVLIAERVEVLTRAEPDSHVLSGGRLMFARPPDFGLAVRQEQMLTQSVIPPCEEGFEYCLYYFDSLYEGTNFESAGLGITHRKDLSEEAACLERLPAGHRSLTPETRRGDGYATSVFSPVQVSGAGHSSLGEVYRLFSDGECYEFKTQIGVSRIENFEAGMVEEFTEADRQVLRSKLAGILESVRFVGQENQVIFAP